MTYIIYDFEVFRYDTLLGCIIIDEGMKTLWQSWDLNEIRKFYEDHRTAIWIGHNNHDYDDAILDAVVQGSDPFAANDAIIKGGRRFRRPSISINSYDLMEGTYYSLKATEGVYGKNISETGVAFDLPRPLTESEKATTESYNLDDLSQTLTNLSDPAVIGRFKTRMNIIKEFGLPLSCISLTDTQLAVKCLGAKAIPGIEYQRIKAPVYPQLRIDRHKELLDFYYRERYREGLKLDMEICGLTHRLGDGGGHGAKSNCRVDKALYLDVSGYYNLLMINLDLLPRTMPKESKELYAHMYREQLRLKTIDPERRRSYKTILLCVWGAMRNEHSAFYDPEKGMLMTITGQLFVVDLLEKLEPYIDLVQTNTDGIIVVPKDWSQEDLVLGIVDEWVKRTGFTIKPKYIYDIVQRDVNNYMYRDESGNIECKGESVKHWDSENHIFANRMWDSKEPTIIAKCIVGFFMERKSPEETVAENKHNFVTFQQICKKGSYDYLVFSETRGDSTTETKVQNVNRVFASKDPKCIGMIYKHKDARGKHLIAKMASLPPSVFLWNGELTDELAEKIDYDYYVGRAKERIAEYVSFKTVKDIKVFVL